MKQHKVISIRHLTDTTFVLKVERKKIPFQTGQFILLSCNGKSEQREYSVYSGEQDDFLEVLVREIDGGKVSGKLKRLKAGDTVGVEGAFGFFRFKPGSFASQKFLFVASGTGISPFHSFVKSYKELNYKLVHGVRYANEAYEHHDFDRNKVVLCTSGEDKGDYNGRVTEFLANERIDVDTNCFLCGNSEMIYEMFDLLTAKGIPVSNIYSEVYF